jgi:hypothetical protein
LNGVPRPRDVSAGRLRCRFQHGILTDHGTFDVSEEEEATAPEGTIPKTDDGTAPGQV